MSPLRHLPPLVGISACLLGEPVRYDGGHRRHPFVVETLGARLTFVPVCPEAELGLGVPRLPMQLRGRGDATRLVVLDSGAELTAEMTHFVAWRLGAPDLSELCGYVFKARSPSCGLASVERFDAAGTVVAQNTSGLFAAALCARWPRLPVVEESQLDEPEEGELFLDSVFSYQRARLAAGA